MCLRSGKIFVEMECPKKNSLPQNDAPGTKEQLIRTMIGSAGTSTSVGVTAPIISQMSVPTTLPEMVVPQHK